MRLVFDSFIYSKQIAHIQKLIMMRRMYLSLPAVSLIVKFSHEAH